MFEIGLKVINNTEVIINNDVKILNTKLTKNKPLKNT